MINNKSIKLLSNIKYPNVIHSGLSEKAILEVFKYYEKKDISFEDVIKVLKEEQKNVYQKGFYLFLKIIEQNSHNLNFKINDEKVSKLTKTLFYKQNKSIKNLLNFISDEKNVFVGDDIKDDHFNKNLFLESLLNCRSYKIYKITNR